jgi:hypothetical protein
MLQLSKDFDADSKTKNSICKILLFIKISNYPILWSFWVKFVNFYKIVFF